MQKLRETNIFIENHGPAHKGSSRGPREGPSVVEIGGLGYPWDPAHKGSSRGPQGGPSVVEIGGLGYPWGPAHKGSSRGP